MNDKVSIVLENGAVFEGERFGAACDSIGELVFTTDMGGYIETLTDPSYYGQIIMQTFPQIGNYGMISADYDSGLCSARGYVCCEHCTAPSNFRAEATVDAFLKRHGIPGVCGIDTRQLTRIIREHGVMNAAIASDPTSVDLSRLRAYKITGAVRAVSSGETVTDAPDGNVSATVVLIDYGAKHNIVRELTSRGCRVITVPSSSTAEEILAYAPDGVILSDGPGDPAENGACIAELRSLLGVRPIFGICLGHQLLALAAGGKTAKLKYGHRGANQPVKDLENGRVYISGQNHGYAVLSDSLTAYGAAVWFENANDKTCEGVRYPEINAFSVQFRPETCAGRKNTNILFDRFVSMLGVRK